MEYRSEAIGILYAEEFGIDTHTTAPSTAPSRTPPRPPSRPSAPPPPPPPPVLTRADMAAACDNAVAAARLAWAQADDARRTAALEALAAGLTEMRAEAHAYAETVAEALAGAALAAVAALLPQLAATHGLDELRALQASLLPALARAAPVVIRVHPTLIDPLQADIDAMPDDVSSHVELRPANLPPGDARMDWPDGCMTRNAASIQAAIIDGFSQMGMLPAPIPTPTTTPEKELHHVQ